MKPGGLILLALLILLAPFLVNAAPPDSGGRRPDAAAVQRVQTASVSTPVSTSASVTTSASASVKAFAASRVVSDAELLFPPESTPGAGIATENLLFPPGEVGTQPAFIMPDPFSTTLRVMTSLIIILVLLFGLSYVLQRRVGLSANVFGKVLGVLPLDGRRFIYLVDVMGRVLVLGVSEQNISFLCELTDKMSVDALRLQSQSSGIPSLEKFFPFLRRRDGESDPLSQGELSERTRLTEQQRDQVEKLLLKRRPSENPENPENPENQ